MRCVACSGWLRWFHATPNPLKGAYPLPPKGGLVTYNLKSHFLIDVRCIVYSIQVKKKVIINFKLIMTFQILVR